MNTAKFKKIGIPIIATLLAIVALIMLNGDRIGKFMGSRHFKNIENEALSQEFKGIETSQGKEENLFPIKATGVSTLPIKNAADTFLNSLSEKQKTNTKFKIDANEWRKWSNVDNGIYKRQGISLKEMTPTQKEAAFTLMQVSLSAKGLQLSKDIMKTDQTLKEIKNGSADFDEELYFITIMGTPSNDQPWGWQLDGHHLVINYFILGDQVVMSPVFMEGEPIITTTGKHKGNTLFQDEQNLGLAFMKSLSTKNKELATLSKEKINDENKTGANQDNITLDYKGLKASNLSTEKKEALIEIIFQYVSNIKQGHQQIKMEEVLEHIDNTWFSWIGTTDENAVFYYRIHCPVIIIEFDHQKPVGYPAEKHEPTRNHIHTMVRTPNGNDYGKELLKQHIATHHQY